MVVTQSGESECLLPGCVLNWIMDCCLIIFEL
jgi:hypothetical protein